MYLHLSTQETQYELRCPCLSTRICPDWKCCRHNRCTGRSPSRSQRCSMARSRATKSDLEHCDAAHRLVCCGVDTRLAGVLSRGNASDSNDSIRNADSAGTGCCPVLELSSAAARYRSNPAKMDNWRPVLSCGGADLSCSLCRRKVTGSL